MKTNGTDRRSKKIEITDAMRKEYGLCEHNEVNYKTLEKFCKQLFLRVKSDKKQFKILAQDIKYKNHHIQELKKIYGDTLEDHKKANEDLKKANTQLILDVEELKQRLFGHSGRKLKNFSLRPDRKKDN